MTMEELDDVLSQALIPVRVAKLLKDNGMEQAFQVIRDGYLVDYYDEFPASIEALENISDYFEGDYNEDEDISTMFFSDQSIMEYYRLCQEETRIKKIRFEESVHVYKAAERVRGWLEAPGCYYCDYRLEIKPAEQWGCGILFLYDPNYFYEFYPLLYNMLGALSFYKESLPALRREVDELKRPFAIVPYDPKGAAA